MSSIKRLYTRIVVHKAYAINKMTNNLSEIFTTFKELSFSTVRSLFLNCPCHPLSCDFLFEYYWTSLNTSSVETKSGQATEVVHTLAWRLAC